MRKALTKTEWYRMNSIVDPSLVISVERLVRQRPEAGIGTVVRAVREGRPALAVKESGVVAAG
jgi:hypothetical protein